MQNVFAAVTDDGHRRLEQDVLPMQKVMQPCKGRPRLSNHEGVPPGRAPRLDQPGRDDAERVAAVALVRDRTNIPGVELQHMGRVLPRGIRKLQRLAIEVVLASLRLERRELRADLLNLRLDR